MSNGNEPAYPIFLTDNKRIKVVTGMSKREYFAGLAMQGVLQTSRMEGAVPFNLMAERCVAYADALLKELEKQDDTR